jgi:single-stranded-DNA-specific exonuclease
MTSMARPARRLLIRLLRDLGHEAGYYIPDRLLEGYGPSGEALVRLGEAGSRAWWSRSIAARWLTRRFRHGEGRRHRRDRCRSPQMRRRAAYRRRAGQPQPARRGDDAAPRTAIWRRSASPSCSPPPSCATLRGAAISPDAMSHLIELLDLVALGTVADVAQLKGLNRALSWRRG